MTCCSRGLSPRAEEWDAPVDLGRAELPTVAVFVGSWLPYSETFIHSQLCHFTRLRASVIAGAKTQVADRFPYRQLTHLCWWQRVGYRHLGHAPVIDELLRRSRARLVLAHFGLHGAFALPFARRAGLPLAVMFHGHDVGGLLPINRCHPRYARYQRLAPALFDYASVLLCASEELRTTLLDLGAPRSKLVVCTLGVDLAQFPPPEPALRWEEPTLLMVGRLVEKKGMSDGLAALRLIRQQVEGARLRIVGDGPLRAQLEQQAHDLGLAGSTTFVGSLPHPEVLMEMRRAHAVLMPAFTTKRGDRESGSLVLKEASALGVAAVATRHGGIPEIIEHDRTGILVGERDVEALAAGAIRLLLEPGVAQGFGDAARAKMFAEYDQVRQVATLERHLLGCLSR